MKSYLSLVPAMYHGCQYLRERTGLLKSEKENLQHQYSPELTQKVNNILQDELNGKTVSVFIDENSALEAQVVRIGNEFKIVAGSLLTRDEDMLMFSLRHELSHIKNEDSLTYSKHNCIHALVGGLVLGYFLPTYAALPLVCWSNYSYGVTKSKNQEARADQDAIKQSNTDQIKGGLRLFKLRMAIYRVDQLCRQEPTFDNLKKLIDQGIEPSDSSHPLDSARIQVINQEIKKRGSTSVLTNSEIRNMTSMSVLFFTRILEQSNKEHDAETIRQTATSLGTFVAFDIMQTNKE